MDFVRCPKCGNKTMSYVDTCKKCGYTEKKIPFIVELIIWVVVTGLCIYLIQSDLMESLPKFVIDLFNLEKSFSSSPDNWSELISISQIILYVLVGFFLILSSISLIFLLTFSKKRSKK